MRALTLLLLSLSPVVLLTPTTAEACSPAPDIQLTDVIPADGLSDVPPQGVVVVFLAVNDSITVQATVVDATGEAIAGTYEVVGEEYGDSWGSITDGRLIWRSDEPLEPNVDYELTIASAEMLYDTGPIVVPFRTSATDARPAPSFIVETTTLSEHVYASEEVCCGDILDSCDTITPIDCWATELATIYGLAAGLSFSDNDGRYSRFSKHAAGEDFTPALAFLRQAHIRISDTVLGDPCLTIKMESFVDGQEFSQTVCMTADELEPDRAPRELHPADVCDDDATPPTLPVDEEMFRGCSLGGPGSSRGWQPLLLVLAMLGIGRRRRT